jgi:DNA-binding MarR family transcriptional regulator
LSEALTIQDEPTTSPAPSPVRVINAIRAIVRAARTSTRTLEMRFGTSAAQLFMLRALCDGEVGSVKELARRTNTHNISASVVVRRLSDRGFVRRAVSADDRRRVGYSITPEGLAFLASAPRAVDDQLLEGLAAMPAADQQRLADLLRTLIQGARIPMCDLRVGEDALVQQPEAAD